MSRRADADSLEEAGEQLFTFTCRRPRSGRARASSDWARRFKRRIKNTDGAAPCGKPLPCCSWAAGFWADQPTEGRGWRTLERELVPAMCTSPPDALFDNCRRALSENFHKTCDTTSQIREASSCCRSAQASGFNMKSASETRRRSASVRGSPVPRDFAGIEIVDKPRPIYACRARAKLVRLQISRDELRLAD